MPRPEVTLKIATSMDGRIALSNGVSQWITGSESRARVHKMRAEHDPIEQVKQRLLDKKWAGEDDLKALDKEVRAIVTDAAEFAQSDPEPDVSELVTDITL